MNQKLDQCAQQLQKLLVEGPLGIQPATHLNIKESIEQDQRLTTQAAIQNSPYAEYLCSIWDCLKDPLQIFKNTNFQGNINQQICDFIYQVLHPEVDEEYIKAECEKIVARFIIEMTKLQNELISRLKAREEKLKDVIRCSENIRNAINVEPLKQAILNFNASPQGFDQLNTDLEAFVKGLHRKDDPKAQALQKDIETLRNKVPYYINTTILNTEFLKIKECVQNMVQFMAPHEFPPSKIANENARKMLNLIDPRLDPSTDSILRFNLVVRLSDCQFDFQKIAQIRVTEYSSLLLIVKTDKHVIAIYNSCPSGNGLLCEKSFIYHLTKNQQFNYIGKTSSFVINSKADFASDLIEVGQRDIVIKSKFYDCESALGNNFDISGKRIGNPLEYIADSQKFKVLDIEIFGEKNTPRLTKTLVEPSTIASDPNPRFTTEGPRMTGPPVQQGPPSSFPAGRPHPGPPGQPFPPVPPGKS